METGSGRPLCPSYTDTKTHVWGANDPPWHHKTDKARGAETSGINITPTLALMTCQVYKIYAYSVQQLITFIVRQPSWGRLLHWQVMMMMYLLFTCVNYSLSVFLFISLLFSLFLSFSGFLSLFTIVFLWLPAAYYNKICTILNFLTHIFLCFCF